MSIYLELSWSIVDKAAVCATQTASTTLLLNGTLQGSSPSDQISFIANDMIRSVSITSTGNFSGINFVVEGLQNNAYVTETLSGPNNNTVYGTKYFDIITKVTSSSPVSAPGVSVGTGHGGYLPLIVVNPNTTAINYSFSVLLKNSTVDYTMFQTLDSINTNFIPFSEQTLFAILGVENKTVSSIYSSTAITNFLLLKVNSSTDTTKFDFRFLQE